MYALPAFISLEPRTDYGKVRKIVPSNLTN
jgi:hypothetical protein